MLHVTIIHTAKYLNDTWIFDTQQYKWQQVDLKEADRKPSRVAITRFLSICILITRLIDLEVASLSYQPRTVFFYMVNYRSIFSYLQKSHYIFLGGYCKEYAKGKRPIGIMLEDTWFLRCVLAVTPRYCITSYSPSQTDS